MDGGTTAGTEEARVNSSGGEHLPGDRQSLERAEVQIEEAQIEVVALDEMTGMGWWEG
jgi:hypothetical protein